MAISKIVKNSITGDAIDATKIADDAISEEHLDITALTGNTLLNEARNDADVLLVYDTSANVLKRVAASNIGAIIPTITSISPTTVQNGDGTGNHTFVITGTNYLSGIAAKLRSTSGADIAFSSLTRNSNTQLTGIVAKSSLPDSGEPYDIVVTQNGIDIIKADQVSVNASPAFVTAAGSLGTKTDAQRSGISFSIIAQDPESAANCTFELQSGSLPAGLALTQSGSDGGTAIISGNATAVGSDTTSTFVLRAVDNASNVTSRTFSITIQAPQFQVFNASGTFSVPSGVSAVDALVVGGGGAGKHFGGGGGAGGLVFMPGHPVTPGATVSVTVGNGGVGEAAWPAAGPGNNLNGQDSVFGTLTAKGGGFGGGYPGETGGQGGSGGGAPVDGPNKFGQGIQSTQPDDSGAYGFGNNGGNSPGPNSSNGGGGGGAAAVGGNGAYPYSNGSTGVGGAGKAYTIADGTTSVYYAGGGGGTHMGNCTAGPTRGRGGQGGGGNAGSEAPGSGAPTDGQAGTANTGGGGGAPGRQGPLAQAAAGASGGKGVVIVRWS
tara:strand:- start:2803 stop:4452 length:1650 start_codon:yes stop_codon:yes gene_type:complete